MRDAHESMWSTRLRLAWAVVRLRPSESLYVMLSVLGCAALLLRVALVMLCVCLHGRASMQGAVLVRACRMRRAMSGGLWG